MLQATALQAQLFGILDAFGGPAVNDENVWNLS